jgi:hypothetical protein
MKKIFTGIFIGIIAGAIDVIPMIIKGLTWDANISAFSMWIIVGLITAMIDLNLNSIIKGILIAFLVLFPSAVLIGWKEPISLIPISVMTLILGGLQGFSIDKILKRLKKNENE